MNTNDNEDLSTYHLLIVDDIPLNLILLEKMLAPFGCQLVKAGGGREALHAIQQRLGTAEKFDLLIVDLMMPDMDGYEVIQSLRCGRHDERYHIPPQSAEQLPIIILSSMNSTDDIHRGLTLGANMYLTKPLVIEQLHSAVTKALHHH